MNARLRSTASAPPARLYTALVGVLALLAIEVALARWWRLFKVFRTVLTGDVIIWDFQVYYTMGYLAGHRLFDQVYDFTTHAQWIGRLTGDVPASSLGFVYPPHFALALAPLSLLSHPVAFRLWFGLNCAVLALACVALWRLAAPAPRWQRALLLACVVSSDATFHVLAAGQVSALLVLSMAVGLLLIRRGRDTAGGAVLALLTVKPQLLVGLLLLLALRGRWRALAGFGATSAVFALTSLIYFGPEAYFKSVDVALTGMSAGGESYLAYTHMHSWRAFLATFDIDQIGAVYGAVLLLMVVTAVWGALWAWRAGPARGDGTANQEWGIAILFPLLITPHLWTQELLFLGLFGALLLSELAAPTKEPRHQLAPAAVLLGGYFVLSLSWSLLSRDISLTILGLLAVFAWSCLRSWRGGAVERGRPQRAAAPAGPRLSRAGKRVTVPLP